MDDFSVMLRKSFEVAGSEPIGTTNIGTIKKHIRGGMLGPLISNRLPCIL